MPHRVTSPAVILVLQDGERGIVVRFSDVHEFALNEDIRIDIGGLEISEFSGLLQINNVPNANATSFGVAAPVTPREITLNELIDNGEEWESTLVKVNGATLSGSSTYNGSINVTDGTATFAMFTRSQATFAETALPTAPVMLTAIVSQFTDRQLAIRNLMDVQ